MTLDRDQIKRDAERWVHATPPDWSDDNTSLVARHCLALLTELEQAEVELLAQRELAQIGQRAAASADYFEHRLAKTPALVEAAKAAMAFVDPATAQDYDLWREALAAWEND